MTIATSIVLACTLCVAGTARAQQPEAESLFREAKALLKKGKIAEACAKLEASEKLDPVVGTQLNLADCREKNKQYASAWAMFLKTAETAKKAKDVRRANEARRRAKLLERKLKYLTIKVADDRRVEGLVITRDGHEVDPVLWNQRVAVDQGTHDIAAKAPNRETWKEQVEIEKADEIVELPMLGEVPAPPVKIEDRVQPLPPAPKVRTSPRRLRGATLASAVATVVGAGAGIAFGLRARSLSNDSDAKCPNTNCFDGPALDQNRSARTSALIANAGFAVGGIGLIATTVLWWKGRPHTPTEKPIAIVPTVTSDEVGVALGGRF